MWFDVLMAATTAHNEIRVCSITKPGYVYLADKCSRCGGSGIYSDWHGVCYRCGGSGQDPTGIRTYCYPADWTDEQIAAHAAKREARAQAAAERKEAKKEAARQEFAAQHPEAMAVIERYSEHDSFIADLASQFRRKGYLSERQIEVLLAKPAQIQERLDQQASATPCPTGTETIVGEVVSAKIVYNDYGSTLKMLVLDDRGFKVWGTVPRSLSEMDLRGVRVRFVAAVEASYDDPLFGFFKRPRKAEVLDSDEIQP